MCFMVLIMDRIKLELKDMRRIYTDWPRTPLQLLCLCVLEVSPERLQEFYWKSIEEFDFGPTNSLVQLKLNFCSCFVIRFGLKGCDWKLNSRSRAVSNSHGLGL